MRLLARVLIAALALTIMTPAAAQASSGFSDVSPGSYYSVPVAWLVDNGVTTGVEAGCFAPDDYVTRGQVAAFLFRLDLAAGNSPTGSDNPFGDINLDYQRVPVSWMYEQGITTGTTPTTFSPDDPVTRGQFAAMLWRYAGRPTPSSAHSFNDVAASWQQAAVSWLAEQMITTGTTSQTFTPDGPLSRAQVATFMWRFSGEPNPPVDAIDDVPCSRDLRLALIDAGLTPAEAACSIVYLSEFTVDELADVLIGGVHPSAAMITAISAAATTCLTPDRVNELTRLLF